MGEYKIKDIETLTGIKSHTIRIWEKRYGILTPQRTETKIRTYSDKDLTTILNVAILNKNGWKISHIADLSETDRQLKVTEIQAGEKGDVHFEKLLLALIEFDEYSFQETLSALMEKDGLEVTYSNHLIEFLERIGVMWVTGTITPAQEHFMSNLIRQKLISATAVLPIPPKDSPKVLLFLPEHEWHELSLLFYHYILRRQNVYSFYLGQSLPLDSLANAVERIQPKAILTSVLTATDDKYYGNLFKAMKKTVGDIPIFAGGHQIKMEEKKLKKYLFPVHKVSDLQPLIDLRST